MNILQTLQKLRDDLKAWVTANLNALNAKIDDKTIPIDNKLDSTSTNPVQNKIVTKAINNIPKFSGDYNDLTNAPIIEDDSGNMVLADESGNIIFKVDADGIHTTAVSLDGEAAATEKYVDDAITKIPTPDVSGQINAHNTNGESHADIRQAIEDAKEELSESITSVSDKWEIADEAGNIIFRVDAEGAHTTSLTLDGEKAATESYVDDAIHEHHIDQAAHTDIRQAIKKVSDLVGTTSVSHQIDTAIADFIEQDPKALEALKELSQALEDHEDAYDALLKTVGGKATYTDLENLKEELSESIVAESDEWKVVDEAGNIIFSVDAEGAHTTSLTLNGEEAATEAYVDDAIKNIDLTEYVKNTDYATTDTAGIIRTYPALGLSVSTDGQLSIAQAEEEHINGTSPFRAITPKNLDYAVKKALTNNALRLTYQDTKTIHNWLHTDVYYPTIERMEQAIANHPNGYKEIKNGYDLTLSFNNAATMDFVVECYPAPEEDIEIPLLVTYYIEEEDFWAESINYFTIPAGSEAIYETLVPAGNAQYGDVYFQDASATENFIVHDYYNATHVKEAYTRLAADKIFITKQIDTDQETGEPIYQYIEVASKSYVDEVLNNGSNIPEIPQWVTDIKTKPGIAEWEQDDAHLTVSKTEKEMWNAKSDFSGSYNDLEDVPDITEDESNNLVIADPDGNIIFRSDADGLETTKLIAAEVTVNGVNVEEAINEINDKTIDKIKCLDSWAGGIRELNIDRISGGIEWITDIAAYDNSACDGDIITSSILSHYVPIAEGDGIEFEINSTRYNDSLKIHSHAITQVSSEDDISDNTTKLYRYIDAEGNPSHIIEVVGSTGARSAGSEYTPIFEGSVNTSSQLTPETFYECFDHSLRGSVTVSATTQAYRLQNKYLDGSILLSGIRFGSSKNAGSITVTPIQECAVTFIKYYTYVANSGSITGYDSNAAISVNGDILTFADDTTPIQINLKAGVEYIISTNPEGYSGRVVLTAFNFAGPSIHHHELARMEDVDAVETALLGTSSDKLGAKTTIYAATSGAIENKANIATNTSAIASLKSSVGNVQIWDAQKLPTAAAKYLNTLYKYQNTIHQCVTIGDGEQKIFPLAITGSSEIVASHYAADGSIYTELGKDFKKYFTIDSVTKGFRNGDSIKLGSSSNTGSIVLTSIAEEEITRIQVGVRAYNDSKSAFRIASGDLDHTWPIASKTEETLLSLYSDESASLGSTFTIETVDSITTVDKEGKETVTTCDKRGIITRIIVDFGNVSYEWKPISGGAVDEDNSMIGTWVFNSDLTFDSVEWENPYELHFTTPLIDKEFAYNHIRFSNNQYGAESDFVIYEYQDPNVTEGGIDNSFSSTVYSTAPAVWFTGGWDNVYDKTIYIHEEPTDVTLISWIRNNATKYATDDNLETTSKTTVGAINEIFSMIDSDEEVTGKWIFNDVIEMPALSTRWNINFSSGGCVYTDLNITQVGPNAANCIALVYYNIEDYDGTQISAYTSNPDSFEGIPAGWSNNLYRTIHITRDPQNAEFVTWLKQNAKRYKGSEGLTTSSKTVIGAINEIHAQLGDIDVVLDAILSQTHAIIGGEQ